ncbi:ERC protein 2 [Electrophorus electricus]|uniref:ERC protein 2 n=1 Tax=Electrophorus electricus TaxID=8005 RepID=UPI0015CFD742|nr:ERC protein 2 [Electrophorus electricus]
MSRRTCLTSAGRSFFGGRATSLGSSPNISSSLDSMGSGDHKVMHLQQLQHQGASSLLLRQVMRAGVRGEGPPLVEQLKDLQRENDLLRRELDVKDSKLGSSVNSIKSFWSPELKKERGMRKEELAKLSILKEKMKIMDEENKHLQMTIQALQEELHTQRDLNELLQKENHAGQPGCTSNHFPVLELTEDNFQHLQAEHERQAKELSLLRKTLEDMERRINTQKQTVSVRDESIKRLLEMLQNKGLTMSKLLDEEGLRVKQETEERLGHPKELYQSSQQIDPAKTKALQTTIDMKGISPDAIWQDSKIASLERNIRDLEDEIQMLRSNGLMNADDKDKELKQMEVCKSHSGLLKNKDMPLPHFSLASPRVNSRLYDQTYMLPQQHKMDQLKQELSKKESEMLALQTKLETMANQNSDCKQHIEVLKESLSAKEQRASILQSEVDALRLRLEERETFLNKKIKQLQDITDEKSTMSGEMHDLKDMLDVKECKISVLQKKIENLQEQVKDKEKQMESLKDRVTSLQSDSSNTDAAFATLEEALVEKDKVMEQLKEQRQREMQEMQMEIEMCKTENKLLKEKIASLQSQLLEKESSVLELRERISSLTSSGLQKDTRLRALESSLERRVEECSRLESQLQKKALESEEVTRMNVELLEKVKSLEKEVALQKDESTSKAEMEQLQSVHKEVESEQTKEKIPELERQENPTPLAEIKPTDALPQPPINQVPADQIPVQVQAEQVPVQVPAEQVPVQVPAEQVPVQVPAEQVPVQVPAEQVPVQVPAEQVPVQVPAEQMQVPAEQVPVPAEQVPVQAEQVLVQAEQVPVQAEQVPVQVQAEQVPVQAKQVPVQAEQVPVQAAEQVPVQVQAEQVPVQAKQVPVQAEQVPVQAEQVPVQVPAEEVPAEQVPVQVPAEQVLMLAKQVPVQAEPVLVQAEQVLMQVPAEQVPAQVLAKQPKYVLQESTTTSAPIKATAVQQEKAATVALTQREELMSASEKARQELDVTKQRLFLAQSSLADRENQLTCMKQEQKKQLEEIQELK